MDTLDRVVKLKTKRAKRFLEKREPKLNENIKNAMLIKGGNANATVTQVLKDVYALKKPYEFPRTPRAAETHKQFFHAR
uniref:Ribosome production factor 2 homolog n=1 Tax=Rhinopithecus roxellana TaxID=61622 RepID=A0A2K6QAU8_RHIRO